MKIYITDVSLETEIFLYTKNNEEITEKFIRIFEDSEIRYNRKKQRYESTKANYNRWVKLLKTQQKIIDFAVDGHLLEVTSSMPYFERV